MKKRIHYQMVILCSAVVLTLSISSIPNLKPSHFPVPTFTSVMNGSWASEVEHYLGEAIGFHDILFRLKSGIDMLMGEQLIQDVYITDEMLLEKITTDESMDCGAMVEGINQFYETYQLPTYLVLVPSSSEIYENQLPNNAVMLDQGSIIRDIYAEANSYVRCVDAHSILSSVSDAYIYYRTDSHWTSYGAYCVYQTAIQKMGFTATPYYRYAISRVSTDFRGDLYERTLYEDMKPDVLDYYHCEDGSNVISVTAYDSDGIQEERLPQVYDLKQLSEGGNPYRFYLGDACEKLVIHTDLGNEKRLLLYKDDFADCMVPFLTQHYSEICIIDLETTGTELTSCVNPEEYTQVLFLASAQYWCDLWK